MILCVASKQFVVFYSVNQQTWFKINFLFVRLIANISECQDIIPIFKNII